MIMGSGRVSLLSGQTWLNWLDSAFLRAALPRTAGPRCWPAGPRRPRARGGQLGRVEDSAQKLNSNKKMFFFFKTVL
jgi:hypothetical protein